MMDALKSGKEEEVIHRQHIPLLSSPPSPISHRVAACSARMMMMMDDDDTAVPAGISDRRKFTP